MRLPCNNLLYFETTLLLAFTALSSGACSEGEKCKPTSFVYCSESHTYRVDTCGNIGEHIDLCECGCNQDHSGCSDCGCTTDCGGKQCGDDGCGGSCGSCPAGQTCSSGQCTACGPDCSGRECGNDGCGGSCGTCPAGQSCSASGQCTSDCTPDCYGRECGNDDCGGSCGTCYGDEVCDGDGQCVSDCTPDCYGRECGDDGCGGTCGSCAGDEVCDEDGQCEEQGLSLQAQAVGAYAQIGSTCESGSIMTDYVLFLCPGGDLRGGGTAMNMTELWCGDFTVSPPQYPDCDDVWGCFPKVEATVKDTLIYGGQQDVEYGYEFNMYLVTDDPSTYLYKITRCNDETTGYIALQRVSYDVTENYCHSAACPQDGGSSGGSGSCGTDCDCGHCWYCENGICYYGGEGQYGCYRGCPW